VAAKPKGQAAPTSDRIREIQTALQKDGSYEGEPTGKWDAATEDAMRKYQDKNGVNPTGKIDAVSLNKLGLGSETAGKGAPVPAATSSTPPATAPAPKPPDSASSASE
jgi:peptidoglycan hydrolase-like protein with peptidoglycan-binding domain